MRRRILVVEDEMVLAMLVEAMVREIGHDVVGPAHTLDQALALARDGSFDLALLDLNLGNGELSTQVALVLIERGIPFVFLTGDSGSEIVRGFDSAAVLEKPFQLDDLQQTLARMTG